VPPPEGEASRGSVRRSHDPLELRVPVHEQAEDLEGVDDLGRSGGPEALAQEVGLREEADGDAIRRVPRRGRRPGLARRLPDPRDAREDGEQDRCSGP
jgi:hypothetical protein